MATNMDLDRGWQVGKTLSQTNAHMFDNEVTCDIKFSVHSADGATVCITAHKYMLVSRSPVFEVMLCGPGDYREKDEDVIITDIEPDVFKAVLRYMYTEDVTLTPHNVLYLMSAAKKYLLDPLVDKCKEFLTKNMDPDNVCTILNHSLLQGEDILIDKCLSFIAPHANEVIFSKSFLELTKSSLETLLKSNILEISSAAIYSACVKWAEANCNQATGVTGENIRRTLGNCLFQIPFQNMTVDEFNTVVGLSDILTDREVRLYNLCLIHPGRHKEAGEQLKKLGFQSPEPKPTQTIKHEHPLIVRRMNNTNTLWTVYAYYKHIGNANVIGFCSSHPILLCGVLLFRSKRLWETESCQMYIYDGTTGQWGHEKNDTLTPDGTNSTQEVMLDTPIGLEANKKHAVKVLISGGSFMAGSNALHSVTSGGVTFTFTDHDEDANGTDCNGGQIPGLIFQTIH